MPQDVIREPEGIHREEVIALEQQQLDEVEGE